MLFAALIDRVSLGRWRGRCGGSRGGGNLCEQVSIRVGERREKGNRCMHTHIQHWRPIRALMTFMININIVIKFEGMEETNDSVKWKRDCRRVREFKTLHNLENQKPCSSKDISSPTISLALTFLTYHFILSSQKYVSSYRSNTLR